MPPEGPARGWRLAGRVSEGVSEFVWGAREAENVVCFACRASLTLMPIAHADRAPLVATAHTLTLPLTRPARRDPFSRAFCNFPTRSI